MKLNYTANPFCHLLLGCCFMLSGVATSAQTEYGIRGRVCNEISEPVPYANISFRELADSSLVGGTITDANGDFFFLSQAPDTLVLTASFIGYASRDTVVRPVAKGAARACSIVLRREQTLLDEVVIRKNRQRAKQQVNQTTYYVNSKMRSASQTGIDLVGQIPGVGIDLMNSVTLNGSDQIIVLVNGMVRSPGFLNQIDASRIDRIEIRSSGTLKYGARVTGVINVILKEEDQKGISGHLYANLPTQSDEVFSFPSASLYYNNAKTTWYASYNGAFSNFNIEGNHHKIWQPGNQPVEMIRTDSLRQDNWSHKLHFGMDHFSNKKNQFSLYGFISGFSNEQDGRFTLERNSESAGTETYHMEKDDIDKNRSAYGSFVFRHEFNPSGVLTMEGGYYLLNSQTALVLTNPESGTRHVSESEPLLNKTDLRANLSSGLSERLSIETGIQHQLSLMKDRHFAAFNYAERVFAGYVQGAFKADRFQFNAGMRTEHSSVSWRDVLNEKRWYLLPQADMKYDFNGKNSLTISYAKQVNRPAMHQLNPNMVTSDPFTFQQGNPGLVPEVTRKISVMNSISFSENFISYGMFYRKEQEVIEDLTMPAEDPGVFHVEKQNMGDLHSAGLKLLGSMNLHDRFSLNSNIECNHVQTRVSTEAFKQGIRDRSGLEIRGNMSAIYAIKNDLSLSASMQFQSPSIAIQNRYREGVLYFVSLKKEFFNCVKLEVTSAVPFLRSFTYQGYEIYADDFMLSSEDNIRMSVVPVWIKLKYAFTSGSKVRHLERDHVFKEQRVKKGF